MRNIGTKNINGAWHLFRRFVFFTDKFFNLNKNTDKPFPILSKLS